MNDYAQKQISRPGKLGEILIYHAVIASPALKSAREAIRWVNSGRFPEDFSVHT
ncbi:hypothetical protein [Anabaena sp. CA = ATCC 33047]|uniref:hypothetical protein n=1 Tax=Anabaena sp. (strain CA / ATCC 33047) TaxID=52271 RepID=UPI000AF05BEA|nr:hypothetical protein [Anabaena sp. CA = ATCC 33047]